MVKVTVLAIEPATGRLKLSLAGKKATDDPAGALTANGTIPYGGLEAGDLAEAVVKQVSESLRDLSMIWF